MNLFKEFGIAVGAAQTGIRVNTDEIPDALSTISAVCQKHGWELRVWDKTRGLQAKDKPQKKSAGSSPLAGFTAAQQMAQQKAGSQQESALAAVLSFLDEPAKPDPIAEDDRQLPVVMVFKNFHLAFERVREEMVSAVQHLIEDGKEKSKCIVGLMPAEAKLPPEVEPLFHVIDHELPDEQELLGIMRGVVRDDDEEADEKQPASQEEKAICKAALGLTRLQAEGVFAASMVQYGKVLPSVVWEHKAKILNREGLVELHKSPLNFSNVGGLHGAKDFLKRICAYDPLEDEDPDARAKGVVAVGPPGVGKSLLAYCLGNELNIVALKANPGNLMDQYVGNTEKNTRKFFQICRRMAPCVVIMDEVGQVMPSGGSDDSNGVAKRMLGTFLTAMNDVTEPIFWFFTSNDIESLHEAFLRAERVDAKIYVRLPDAEQRAEVWRIYINKFFPPQVKGKDDPLHISLDLESVLGTYKKLKKVNPIEYGAKLAVALMAVPAGKKRDALLQQVKATDDNLFEAVQACLIDDDGWTPAEIRSCCRLMRRLKMPLHETSKRIGHVAIGEKGEKMLRRLDRWAVNDGAIDAESGELFVPDSESEKSSEKHAEDSNGQVSKKVRRKIPGLKKPSHDD